MASQAQREDLDAASSGAVVMLSNTRSAPQNWPRYHPAQTARDFMLWRHMRVARARVMRRVRRVTSFFSPNGRRAANTSVYGVAMHANWADRTYAYCHYGTYGSYLADIIQSLECPFAFIDVGANQGLFSLIAAKNPACKLAVAIEPVADTYDWLERNIALNKAQDRIVALECAMSDEAGVRMLTRKRVHSGVATFGDHIPSPHASTIRQPVCVRRMEQLEAFLPAGLPLFIKVDVAGHEATVIDDILGSSCANRVIGLFYEEDDRLCDTAKLNRALERANLTPVRRYGRKGRYDVLAVPASRLNRSRPRALAYRRASGLRDAG